MNWRVIQAVRGEAKRFELHGAEGLILTVLTKKAMTLDGMLATVTPKTGPVKAPPRPGTPEYPFAKDLPERLVPRMLEPEINQTDRSALSREALDWLNG